MTTILLSLLYLVVLVFPYCAHQVEYAFRQYYNATFDSAPYVFIYLLLALYGGILFLVFRHRYKKEAVNLIVHIVLATFALGSFWFPFMQSYLFGYLTAIQIGGLTAMIISDIVRIMSKKRTKFKQ